MFRVLRVCVALTVVCFALTVQAQSSIDATKSAAEKGDAEAQKALESINKNKDVPTLAAK